jgi:RNA polymerase sigma factor (sigma-70 family)
MKPETDTDRFLGLLEAHRGILYKVAHGYCRDREDRRDLVQEMTVGLWRSYPGFDGRVAFSTWMYRVALNIAISHLRRESRRLRDTVPLEEGVDFAAADRLLDGESDKMRTLRTLLGRLDALDRALVLLFLDGVGHEEIAGIVGITATNVATRLHRLKQRLQREFENA